MTRLIGLTIKNYRPFYEKITISFSTDSKKHFNVVVAGTGGGKTTILDAIAWCLYGKEIYKSSDYPMLNDKKRDELKNGETAKVQIEIMMGENEKEIDYIFSRSLTFIKENDKIKAIPHTEESKTKIKDARDNLIDADNRVVVNRVFPENIRHLFMFDGEALQRFFDEDNIKNTKKAILDITQIDFLGSAIKHLKEISKSYRQEEEENPQIQEYETLIKSVDRELDRLNIERKQQQENLESAKNHYTSLVKQLDKFGRKDEDLKRFIEEEKTIISKLEENKELLKRLEKESFIHLLNSVPLFFCRDKIKKAVKIINSKYESGELPPALRVDFLDKLLNAKPSICICGRSLKNATKERKRVEEYRNKAPLSKYEDDIRNGQIQLKILLKETSNFLKEREGYYKQINKARDEISDFNQRLESIKKERKGIKEEEIESLISQRNFQFREIERYNNRLGEIDSNIKENNKKKIIWEGEKRKLEKESIRNREMREKFDICDISITFFEKIKEGLITEVKQVIERKTNEIFNKGVEEPRVDKVCITNDFECQVLNKFGESIYGTLSSGQKEILAVSFMIALRKESGFDSPILFDYPWGRIDPDKTTEIIESLKKVLEEVQVNFFLIRGREFTDSVKHQMRNCTGSLYEIKKLKDKPMSEVIKNEGN